MRGNDELLSFSCISDMSNKAVQIRMGEMVLGLFKQEDWAGFLRHDCELDFYCVLLSFTDECEGNVIEVWEDSGFPTLPVLVMSRAMDKFFSVTVPVCFSSSVLIDLTLVSSKNMSRKCR